MAADVSSMVKGRNSEILITRDLLGGLSKVGNASPLDLDLHLRKSCSEMPLHLQISGMVYPHRCNSPTSPLSSSFEKRNHNKDTEKTIQESPPLKFLEESCLELKLLPSSHCQSVCTLDKVKSALQRAEKETFSKKRSSKVDQNDNVENQEQEEEKGGDKGMFAAGCPGCLMYVMTLKTNPKCPRCNSTVPSPFLLKKRRIDLNA